MFISVFSFIGFLLIASIIKISIFPPSNAGIGKRFVTPSDIEINAIIYTNSLIPFVLDTTSDIPTGPIILSTPICPVNSCFILSTIDNVKSFTFIHPFIHLFIKVSSAGFKFTPK